MQTLRLRYFVGREKNGKLGNNNRNRQAWTKYQGHLRFCRNVSIDPLAWRE